MQEASEASHRAPRREIVKLDVTCIIEFVLTTFYWKLPTRYCRAGKVVIPTIRTSSERIHHVNGTLHSLLLEGSVMLDCEKSSIRLFRDEALLE